MTDLDKFPSCIWFVIRVAMKSSILLICTKYLKIKNHNQIILFLCREVISALKNGQSPHLKIQKHARKAIFGAFLLF